MVSQLHLRIFWMFSTICWQFRLQFSSVTHLQDLKLLLTNEESREVLRGPVLLTNKSSQNPQFFLPSKCNTTFSQPSKRESIQNPRSERKSPQVLRNQTLLSALKIRVWTELPNKSIIQGTTLIYLVHLNFKINTARLDKNLFVRNCQ